MDDEGAAVEKFVQCAQVAGEAWCLGEVVWGEAVGVGGAGVGAGLITAWKSSPMRPEASKVTASMVSRRAVAGWMPVACTNTATKG